MTENEPNTKKKKTGLLLSVNTQSAYDCTSLDRVCCCSVSSIFTFSLFFQKLSYVAFSGNISTEENNLLLWHTFLFLLKNHCHKLFHNIFVFVQLLIGVAVRCSLVVVGFVVHFCCIILVVVKRCMRSSLCKTMNRERMRRGKNAELNCLFFVLDNETQKHEHKWIKCTQRKMIEKIDRTTHNAQHEANDN